MHPLTEEQKLRLQSAKRYCMEQARAFDAIFYQNVSRKIIQILDDGKLPKERWKQL